MRDESRSETMEKDVIDEVRLLRMQRDGLVAALREIDAIATGKQAKAIIRAQQVARAAIVCDALFVAELPEAGGIP